jgi:hypothetical protein
MKETVLKLEGKLEEERKRLAEKIRSEKHKEYARFGDRVVRTHLTAKELTYNQALEFSASLVEGKI